MLPALDYEQSVVLAHNVLWREGLGRETQLVSSIVRVLSQSPLAPSFLTIAINSDNYVLCRQKKSVKSVGAPRGALRVTAMRRGSFMSAFRAPHSESSRPWKIVVAFN